MDELKSTSLPFELLLTILQGYRSQIHCRYSNCYALWNEVHITSIYSPDYIYDGMVAKHAQARDTIRQLLRRINKFVYHYQDGETYKEFELSSEQYENYDQLKRLAHADNQWQFANEIETPFDYV